MAVPKTTAILLRKFPLTDTSLIVHWCSPEHGLIKTAAKGARRPGSPLTGQLDLFYEVEMEYAPARRGDLHTLRDASVTNYRHGLQSSYLRVLAAAYFVRLIEMVAERETPIAGLHDLLTRALNWLCAHEPNLKGVERVDLISDPRVRIPVEDLLLASSRTPTWRVTPTEPTRLTPESDPTGMSTPGAFSCSAIRR